MELILDSYLHIRRWLNLVEPTATRENCYDMALQSSIYPIFAGHVQKKTLSYTLTVARTGAIQKTVCTTLQDAAIASDRIASVRSICAANVVDMISRF